MFIKVKHVIAKYHTTGMEAIVDSALKQALMADQSEPFALWDSRASPFLLPLDKLPNGATDTRKAIAKLAVGNAPA
eukprot:12924952-Prorocentrum_lima.AAC.1